MTQRYFAPCPRGLEPVLAEEMLALGATRATAVDGGVAFEGDWALLYRANLGSRIASRILWHAGEAPYRTEEDIYRAAAALPWPQWFSVDRTLRVYASATRSPVKSLDFVTLRVKDAVCDSFRAASGARPDIDTRNPEVRVHAFLDATRATFYLDTSGEPLFKRGYRDDSTPAPLRENLAAGILRIAGWTPGTPLLDPMCGGGTFLCEAAMMTLAIPPGIDREFAFDRLAFHDAQLWREVRDEAAAARKPATALPLFGSDKDGRALKAAQAALRRAGLEGVATLRQADILDIEAPAPSGLLVANPPYGVRLGEQQALAEFYPRLGDTLKRRFAGWTCCLLSADQRLPKLIGLKPSRRTPLFNGALECRLYRFEMVAGSMRRP
jgi:putative N6-adenine-specific DNA methylase